MVARIPRGNFPAKVVVALAFTLCSLLIILVRTQVPRDAADLDLSSLITLAASLQQGALSGRDFISILRTGAEILAWIATSITATGSAVDAYGIINGVFNLAVTLLVAAVLLICDRINWKQSIIVYAFAFFMNLFFALPDLRTGLLAARLRIRLPHNRRLDISQGNRVGVGPGDRLAVLYLHWSAPNSQSIKP